MLNILRRTPEPISSDYTSSHTARGADYDDNFVQLPHRRLLWDLEQEVLSDLLPRTQARVVLDVACGTGRIAEVITRVLPTAEITGIDVSETMLAQAKERIPEGRFLRIDIRHLNTVVPDGSVDLVTAFRFFPNADPALRAAATAAIAGALRPGGFLIMNNHRNFWSPSYVVRRAVTSRAPGARNADLLDPFRERGFAVAARRSLGVLPHSDRRSYLIPPRSAARVERANLRLLSSRHALGSDTVWLLEKSASRWPAPPDRDSRRGAGGHDDPD